MAVERLFFSKNAQTAFGVGQARGVVLLAAAQHGVPVREATPNEVKSAIAGYGAADKEQVQRMVQLVLGMAERPRPDDAADALAIAVWAANSDREVGQVGRGHGRRSWTARRSRRSRAASPGYERAVREALAREKAEAPRRQALRLLGASRDRVGRGRGRGDHRRFAGHRGRRDRLSRVRGAAILATAAAGRRG